MVVKTSTKKLRIKAKQQNTDMKIVMELTLVSVTTLNYNSGIKIKFLLLPDAILTFNHAFFMQMFLFFPEGKCPFVPPI